MTAIDPAKTLVVIPTYNEAQNIRALIQLIWQSLADVHVLVVDDNSQDGTADIVMKLQKDARQGKSLFIMQRSGKLGLGTAYIEGFTWGMIQGYLAYIEMDADFSHDPKELPHLLTALSRHHVAVGSRYVAGGSTENWNVYRKIISKTGSFYARLVLNMTMRDVTGGFNAWRLEVLERINLNTIRSEGYSFQIELKYRAQRAGFNIVEHPITFSERREGQSKMSSGIVFEALLKIWSFRYRQWRNPV